MRDTESATATATSEALMKRRAESTIKWLGLAGFDDDSVAKADAWIDSADGVAALAAGQSDIVDGLWSYLGEVLVHRYGGAWSFGKDTSPKVVSRLGTGTQLSDPFGKVYKRVTQGPSDNLLAFVRLIAHVGAQSGGAPPTQGARPKPGAAEWKGTPSPVSGPSPLRLVAWGSGLIAAAVASGAVFGMRGMLAMIWVCVLFVSGLFLFAGAAFIALMRRT